MSADVSIAPPPTLQGQLKGWHALVWFLGFFAFMFLVNGIFLWTAITTFPGEDIEKSYLTGLDYNTEIARKTLQANSGWTAEIGLTGLPTRRGILVRLIQRDGSALTPSAATLQLRHPADRSLDRTLELIPTGGGAYTAALGDLAPGIWTAQLSADLDPETEGFEFKASRELIIP